MGLLAQRLKLRRVPELRLVNRPVPPLVWAMFGRPTILLPERLLDELSDDERTALLAHELVHLERCDHLLRWLELAALALYWWHPVAWWARQKLKRPASIVAMLACCRCCPS